MLAADEILFLCEKAAAEEDNIFSFFCADGSIVDTGLGLGANLPSSGTCGPAARLISLQKTPSSADTETISPKEVTKYGNPIENDAALK